jgi:small subunit ribosomal protein S2
MADVGMKELLQAGVHFGHQTSRWNPKMRKYIFAERSGIYLLDLRKTLRQLERAREMIRETVEEGKGVLFVCTKPQLAEVVRKEAERCGAFHVTERWVGGLLTNFQTIKKNIRRLKELEQGLEEGHFDYYTKKEQILLDRERQKLDRYLNGIKDMTKLPGLVFVVDAKREEIAVKEADRLDIPVVAIADTNADPDRLTIPIPGNDDALRAVSLITRHVADAVEAARREVPEAQVRDEAEVYTYSSDAGETVEGGEAPGRKKKRPRRRPKPEVIARARKEKDEEGEEEEPSEAATTEGGPEQDGAAAAADGEQPEAQAEQEPDARAEEGEASEESEEEAVAVSSASGSGEDEEEEAPPS